MDLPYLVRSKHHLAQYLACNALPKGYHFYSLFWIPADKDPPCVDAKVLFTYTAYLDKAKRARRKKAGHASVKYVRLGRLGLLVATKGNSPFFQREAWVDAREEPIKFGGYSVGVGGDGRAYVRLHREAQRRFKLFILKWGHRRPAAWWERWFWRFQYLPFKGVRDNVFALIRFLNANRKSFRQPPIDWRTCVRKKFKSETVWLDSPAEVVDLLRWELRKQ